MEINFQDRGNYFRGLLILIGKDNIIDPMEKNKILEIGKGLGFDPKFCEEAVKDFLSNEFISDSPPYFTTTEIAQNFLIDAINLSIVDNDLHIEELQWLRKVSMKNEIDTKWLDGQIQKVVNNHSTKNYVNLIDE